MLKCYLDEVYSEKYGHSLRCYLESRDFFTEPHVYTNSGFQSNISIV